MYLNKVMIVGNLTRDPELKALPTGKSVVSFSVAVNRTWKDKDGQKQEDAEFFNVVGFEKKADAVYMYVKKGDQIYVEGRMKTRKWDKDGVTQYRTELIMESFEFGSKKEAAERTAPSKTAAPVDFPEDDINPEDVPF